MTRLGLIWVMGCADSEDEPPPSKTGDTSDTSDTSAPPTGCVADHSDSLGSEPVFDKPHGLLRVHNDEYYPYLEGAVADRARLELHVEAERIGQCRLLTYTPSSCDPACGPGEMCLESSCETLPQRVGAGPLTLGSDAAPLEIQPDALDGYFLELGAPLTGTITASAQGDEVPAFTLSSCPVQALQPTGDWSAQLAARADGEDVILEWSDPDPAARLYLRMTTGVATHGGIAHAEVECEGPDTGSLTLPGSFLDELYSEGWSCGECGGSELVRYRSGSAQVGDGTVQLSVQTRAYLYYIP